MQRIVYKQKNQDLTRTDVLETGTGEVPWFISASLS